MSDRREAERVAVRFTATYRSLHQTVEGTVTCMSRRGLFFRGAMGDDVGTHAVVALHVADQPITLRGRIARHHGEGLGLRFDDLADSDRRLVANILLSAHSAR